MRPAAAPGISPSAAVRAAVADENCTGLKVADEGSTGADVADKMALEAVALGHELR